MGLLEGRKAETASLVRLLEGVAGHGGAVLLRGEAGIGKSSILAEAAREARHRGFRVLTASGVQSESQLPFGGLHQLLRPVREHIERLPERLRGALLGSLGVVDSAASAPYLIAFATLDLLAEAAHGAPILLDSRADVRSFVARRLDSKAVAPLS